MDFEAAPGFERGMSKRIADATQEAVEATVHGFATDSGLDVEERFRAEMLNRGITLDDTAWVTQVSADIRSGEPVVVGEQVQKG